MCIHCCRLRKTPCPTIPYSCPHCPVNTISSSCRLSDPRSFGENPFPIGRISNPPSDPCHSLPPRWLEVNRRVIYALAKRMGRSPEAAHYAVLLLLYANYGKVLRIAQKRRSFPVPRCGFPEQDFFCTGGSLFNDSGFLTDPMAPDTLAKLLRMLQDYISRLRELNKKFKWYANGEDRDEILCLLGEQDELVRLLRAIFGNKDVVPIPQLLRALCDLDFNYLTSGKLTSKKSPWRVKHISDLYSEVVDPYKSKKCSSGDSRAFPNRIQEVTIQTVISPKKPQCPCGARTVQVRVRSQRDNKQQLPSKPSFAYLKAEPFDSSKKSTDAPKAKHRHHRKKQMQTVSFHPGVGDAEAPLRAL
nr:uncharacterized protein LOC108070892 isoform X2 [Drosophila kikkawai]